MKLRYRLFRRSSGVFFVEDCFTRQQESLRTKERHEAQRLWHAKNEAHQQPQLNLQIARAYLAASDPQILKRTWQNVMDAISPLKHGVTGERWLRAIKEKAFDPLRGLPLLQTRPEHLLKTLQRGTISTNVFLRRMHNFALDMAWLPWPIMPKKQWPIIRFKDKRAIRLEEHQRILAREPNPERKAFYELAWHIGASQSDLASLDAKDIDWENHVITFCRKKTKSMAIQNFGDGIATILRRLPSSGALFPYLRNLRASDRATEFKQRCNGLGITGVSLHSYRYAWAERAKSCGYPERFAQEALGHNSKAVHRAYSRKAQVKLPALEDYEKAHAAKPLVPVDFQNGMVVNMEHQPALKA